MDRYEWHFRKVHSDRILTIRRRMSGSDLRDWGQVGVTRESTQELFLGGWTTILTFAPSGSLAICLCMSPSQPTLS